MKRLVAAALAAFLLIALPSVAQQRERESFDRQEAGRERQRPPAREAAWPGRHAQEGRDGGRMSPEERQQLRRDINSHGRDIYRDRKDRR